MDETKDWINEKNQALNNDNYGHDLASVQALQRKHEGLERDLAALGEKVTTLVCFSIYLISSVFDTLMRTLCYTFKDWLQLAINVIYTYMLHTI